MNIDVKQLVLAVFMAGTFAIIAVVAYQGISTQAKRAMGSI